MSENLNKLFSPVLVVEALDAAKSLDVYDSGKIFMLDKNTGFTVTLPAVADAGAGWWCKFIVKTVGTYIITEKTSDDTNVLVTQITELETDTEDDQPSSTGHTTITMTAGMSPVITIGDTYTVVSNGTNYFIQGVTKLDGGAALA